MKRLQEKFALLHVNSPRGYVCVCMCDERPEAISACTAEQSFGSRSECESQKTDRSAAGEDTMTMKPHLDTFLIVHFPQREKHKGRQREERGAQ